MYEPGTTLVRKDPKDEDHPAYPYNRVRVIGASPVSHSGSTEQWEGAGAAGVLIEPLTSFGGNLDEPFGKLQAIYDVESIPDNTVEAPTIRQYDATTSAAGPTPEEVFAAEAPGRPRRKGADRFRSPLEDPRPSGDPLDVLTEGDTQPVSDPIEEIPAGKPVDPDGPVG